MALPPRSQRLIAFVSAAGGGSNVFIVPDGQTVIVKSILYANAATATITGRVNFYIKDGSVQVALMVTQIAAGDSAYRDMWVVMNPGDRVGLYLSAGPGSGWLSGSVLAGAPQIPPVNNYLDALSQGFPQV